MAPDTPSPETPQPGPIPTTVLQTRLRAGGAVLEIELDHGRANEMGSAALDDWERIARGIGATDVRALVTHSRRTSRKGTPIFIAGADVTERVGWSDGEVKSHVRRQRRVLAELRRAPVFHVALVNGVALGWGTEFLICCDYRIAVDAARFGLPETGLGILPGAGGTSELWALIGVPQALRLGMTGERIDAEEALRIGLIQERASSLDAGMDRALALAALVGRRSPTAVAAFKRGVLDSVGRDPLARAEREARAYEHCVDSGEAAIGRANFKSILKGEAVAWGPRATEPQ